MGHSHPTGSLRCRTLSDVPRQRCRLRGTTRLADPLGAAAAFQERYDSRLQLLRNDCRHRGERLVAHLLGSSTGGTGGTGSG